MSRFTLVAATQHHPAVTVAYTVPPVYEACVRQFGPLPPGCVFAWADTVYAPQHDGVTPSPEILAHECVHFGQQERSGGPELWWQKYLAEAAYRLQQEVPAHRVQWQVLCRLVPNRNARRRYLHHLAAQLAGPMYGHLMTARRAEQAITR